MTKDEKAGALARRAECVNAGIKKADILNYATDKEIYGYYKGVFQPSFGRRPANVYTLIRKIKERKQKDRLSKRQKSKSAVRRRPNRRGHQLVIMFPGYLARCALGHVHA
jgi:hypothetical protein